MLENVRLKPLKAQGFVPSCSFLSELVIPTFSNDSSEKSLLSPSLSSHPTLRLSGYIKSLAYSVLSVFLSLFRCLCYVNGYAYKRAERKKESIAFYLLSFLITTSRRHIFRL